MTGRNYLSAIAACLALVLVLPALAEAPEGWFLAGSKPEAYETGLDSEVSATGGSSAFLKSKDDEIGGFGTLMQNVSPEDYRGQRVRLSGYVKSDSVGEWAGLWMRIDGPERGKSLAFDNMQPRSIQGTTDWKVYEVVLDVSKEATNVAFGFLLSGTGQVWVDSLKLDIVGADIPVTDMLSETKPKRRKPANLDFEER